MLAKVENSEYGGTPEIHTVPRGRDDAEEGDEERGAEDVDVFWVEARNVVAERVGACGDLVADSVEMEELDWMEVRKSRRDLTWRA